MTYIKKYDVLKDDQFVNGKKLLTKLFASENLTMVINPTVNTPCIDIKKRIVHIPAWSEISNDLFNLMISHEAAGHGQLTPVEDLHQELGEISDRDETIILGDNKKLDEEDRNRYFSYVNIVEDARIEKYVKKEHPGLIRSYRNGYNELYYSGFFLPHTFLKLFINQMSLGDRINLYAKLTESKYVENLDVPFNNPTEIDLRDRTMNVSTFEEVKKLAKEIMDYDKENCDEPTLKTAMEEFIESDQADAGSGKPTKLTQKERDQIRDYLEGSKGKVLVNITDQVMHDSMSGMKQAVQSEFNYNFRISEAKCKLRKFYYGDKKDGFRYSPETFNFLQSSKKLVQNLVKEFLYQKEARKRQLGRQTKTGLLNMTKLSEYKYNDDLFRKTSILPKGKNHGVVVLIDGSSSMTSEEKDMAKAINVLGRFCNQVSIPFSAMVFNDPDHRPLSSSLKVEDYMSSHSDEKETSSVISLLYDNMSLGGRKNQKALNDFLSKVMSGQVSMTYGTTPLYTSLGVMTEYVKKFKELHKLDVVTFICFSDGGDNGRVFREDHEHGYGVMHYKNKVFVNHGDNSISIFFKYLKEECAVNVQHIYIGSDNYCPFIDNVRHKPVLDKEGLKDYGSINNTENTIMIEENYFDEMTNKRIRTFSKMMIDTISKRHF